MKKYLNLIVEFLNKKIGWCKVNADAIRKYWNYKALGLSGVNEITGDYHATERRALLWDTSNIDLQSDTQILTERELYYTYKDSSEEVRKAFRAGTQLLLKHLQSCSDINKIRKQTGLSAAMAAQARAQMLQELEGRHSTL
jgi:hypothetical protein